MLRVLTQASFELTERYIGSSSLSAPAMVPRAQDAVTEHEETKALAFCELTASQQSAHTPGA
jgi:hypothetical protein